MKWQLMNDKSKLIPVLKHHAMKTHGGEGGWNKAPSILNLGTRWRRL